MEMEITPTTRRVQRVRHQIAARDYTPRSFDTARRELVIEFALHGAGPAAAWAVRQL